jgi:serine/threonine protein kinase
MNKREQRLAICPVCASHVPPLASFCTHCGTQLAHCPICATLVVTGPTFCPGCGAQLALSARKASQGAESSSSIKLSDATLFLNPREKRPDEVLPLQQKSLNTLEYQSLAAGEVSRDEVLPIPSASSAHSPQVAAEEEREPVIAETSRSDRVGQRLGNYQLVRFLGEGGFAEVYLGEHIHLGSPAAIKILQSQLTRNDLEHFRAEARTLVRLIHPHIVRVLEFGIEGKTPFLVMDYASNGTLRQLHRKGERVPLAIVISHVKQIAEALQFAHDEKIIHRDIKPENMLVGRRHDILLSDFGIATIALSSRYRSVLDMAGTIAYMAPEQIQAHPRPASDQYALGVVVYEWLCGERPFRGSFQEIAVKQAVVAPPSLRERVPGLPAPVEQVVFKALAKDPKSRFESVWSFALALEQAQ